MTERKEEKAKRSNKEMRREERLLSRKEIDEEKAREREEQRA